MRRKVLSNILAICMVFSLLPTMAWAVDSTPPSLSTATIDGASLVLTYNETLDESSTPDASNFTVSGIAAGNEVSSVAVSGSTVTLTMTYAAVSGDTVTISYAPGDSPIKDVNGNNAEALSEEPVTNNTSAVSSALVPLTVTVTADDNYSATISVSGNSGSVKYVVVTDDPSTVIAAWTIATTDAEALTALDVAGWQDTAPTLSYKDNAKYMVAVEVADGKLVAAGFALIEKIASPYTFDDSSISQAVEGGAGFSQTIDFTDSGIEFTGNEYVVVQITTGSGENIQNTMVMMIVQAGTTSMMISYDRDATQVSVWLTSGMPDLNSASGIGVTNYDKCDLK